MFIIFIQKSSALFFQIQTVFFIYPFKLFTDRVTRLYDTASSLRDYTMQLRDVYNTQIDVTIKQDENGISFEAKNQSAYINPETMNNLFKKYVSHAAKFNKVGVGLGLYLSKQIIDAHDGEIYARSFEDNHNIFGFILPLVNKTESNSVVA